MSPTERYLKFIDEIVRARSTPISHAVVRLHAIDGVPLEDMKLENHLEEGSVERDVLLVRGVPTFEVTAGFRDNAYVVTPKWLDGRG